VHHVAERFNEELRRVADVGDHLTAEAMSLEQADAVLTDYLSSFNTRVVMSAVIAASVWRPLAAGIDP
jgi:hypothetical protein